ncbi:MAG: aa3-type cytochrome c oxidase subunit IV [Sphingomicrobium sp.]
MVANGIEQNDVSGMDLPAHERNYDGFLKVLKRSTIAVAIIAAIVVYIIAS